MKQYLSLSITPKSSNIKIDETDFNTTDGTLVQPLDLGLHTIEITAEKYESQKINIEIREEEATQLEIKLKPIFNTIEFTSTPDNVEVWFDGKEIGVTPCRIPEVFSGVYKIVWQKDEYKTINEEIKLGDGESLTINRNLEELAGGIEINVEPEGSDIYLDNKCVGKTPLILNDVKRGDHKLKIVAPDGNILEELIHIRGGVTDTYSKDIPHATQTDYSSCRIGDYFYSDGSFSHTLNQNKQPIGIVFSLSTTEEEKARGWVNGHIIALRDHYEKVSWAKGLLSITGYSMYKSLVNNFKKYEKTRKPGLLDKNGFLHTMRSQIDQRGTHPAFEASLNYQPKKKLFEKRSSSEKYALLPEYGTSGWYLPSAAQWADVIEKIGSVKLKRAISGKFFCRSAISRVKKVLNLSAKNYWTSLIYSEKESWVCNIGIFGVSFKPKNNNRCYSVRPVAAF